MPFRRKIHGKFWFSAVPSKICRKFWLSAEYTPERHESAETFDFPKVILRKGIFFCGIIRGKFWLSTDYSRKVSFFREYLCQIKTKFENISWRSSGAYEVLFHEKKTRPKNSMLQYLYMKFTKLDFTQFFWQSGFNHLLFDASWMKRNAFKTILSSYFSSNIFLYVSDSQGKHDSFHFFPNPPDSPTLIRRIVQL